jgi:hypothetical protein
MLHHAEKAVISGSHDPVFSAPILRSSIDKSNARVESSGLQDHAPGTTISFLEKVAQMTTFSDWSPGTFLEQVAPQQ